jgi:RHH-type rel operon transcriptional repressor/antitoxin RelB
MSRPISIRLPDALATELDDAAESADRSRSWLIQKALEAYLADLSDLQISLDRLRDPADPVITLKEMRTELGL